MRKPFPKIPWHSRLAHRVRRGWRAVRRFFGVKWITTPMSKCLKCGELSAYTRLGCPWCKAVGMEYGHMVVGLRGFSVRSSGYMPNAEIKQMVERGYRILKDDNSRLTIEDFEA